MGNPEARNINGHLKHMSEISLGTTRTEREEAALQSH
jgi:hypothetical protein